MASDKLTDAAAEAIEQRESKARHALFDACKNKFQLRASIPAEPNRDHDLLIAASLDDNVTLLADRRALRAELAAVTAERDAMRAVVESLLEMGSKAADDIARVGEFHTAGAWLWSSLDRSRPEFEEAEWRRKRAEEIKDEMWVVLHPLIPDDEAKEDNP